MFRRIFFAALLTGVIGGAVVSLVQTYTTTPIILLAEQYETGGDKDNHHQGFLDRHINLVSPVLAHDGKTSSPTVSLERSLTTLLANILMGFGFALILTACYAISGKRMDGRHGVLWGLSGFGIVSLAPALGLPPELPGTLSAELGMRQGWWFLCVAATAIGLWGMVYRSGPVWLALGILLIALPHIIGAPQPPKLGTTLPAEIAAHFVSASLCTAAIFWCALGWLSGTFWSKFEPKQ